MSDLSHSVAQLCQQLSMTVSPSSGDFYTDADQRRYWLSDPILYPDAVDWFTYYGWTPVLSEYGAPFDFLSPGAFEK